MTFQQGLKTYLFYLVFFVKWSFWDTVYLFPIDFEFFFPPWTMLYFDSLSACNTHAHTQINVLMLIFFLFSKGNLNVFSALFLTC